MVAREVKLVYSTGSTNRYQERKDSVLHTPRGRGFSYSDSFSFKDRNWLCGSNPTMGLSFGPRDCFSNSSGPGFEGRYLSLFLFGTTGKCTLDFVLEDFRTIHDGF